MTCDFLGLYDTLRVIGHGAFGIVGKVRRKSMIFARKELNFGRTTEGDRKQITAEVNILKDLHHNHIVRYTEKYVDHEADILSIIMEYCGGGHLSTTIKRAVNRSRPIPEDTIWAYLMQILLALDHCHTAGGGEGKVQVVHRDLKPENSTLPGRSVKLGDFGMFKVFPTLTLGCVLFCSTPHYMSPELMHGTTYNSKTDIWSLGCLLYELKPKIS
ncbi:NEK2 protein [Mycena leptocephala]|nr:NEK2 protein [Mycena leptocephala]